MTDFSHVFDTPRGHSGPAELDADPDLLGSFTPGLGDFASENIFDDLLQQLDSEVNYYQSVPSGNGAAVPNVSQNPGFYAAPQYPTLQQPGTFGDPLYGYASAPPMLLTVPDNYQYDNPAAGFAPVQLYSTYAGVPVPDVDVSSLDSKGSPQQQTLDIHHDRISHKRKNDQRTVYPNEMTAEDAGGFTSTEFDRMSPLTIASTNSGHMFSAQQGEHLVHDSAPIKSKNPLIQWPVKLFQFFNGGDFNSLRTFIDTSCSEKCALCTTALEEDLIGRENVFNLFQALYDAHPDGVFVAKKCALNADTQEITCRVYFAGTRVVSPLADNLLSLVAAQKATNANGGPADRVTVVCCMPAKECSVNPFIIKNEYLFHKPRTSLTSMMDTAALSKGEIDAMIELERHAKNLAVFVKGGLTLKLSDSGDQIARVDFQYTISSFRDADFVC